MRNLGAVFVPWLLLLCVNHVSALDIDELTEYSLAQLSQLQVSIATGAPKALTEAPAGTSVITAADIRAMGAQSIDEALETVPGLHVSRSSLNYAPRYFFRGVVSTYNPQALMLVNGIPESRLFFGDRGERIPNQHSFPVKSIERIEIIRGPGSALYGADAFSGVINIITRDAESLAGTEVSASYGSFATLRSSLAQPFELGSAKGALFLSYQDTDGDKDVVIASDLQSNLDAVFGSSASFAPAPAQLQSTFFNAGLDLAWDNFRVRAAWRRAWDVGNGYGISSLLDPYTQYMHEDGSMDLTWRRENILPQWDIEAQVSYQHSFLDSDRQVILFAPGAIFPPATTFPEGVLGKASVAEENARFDLKSTYRGVRNHTITLGAGYFWGDLYKTTDDRNYQFVAGNPFPLPLIPARDVADTELVFQPEAQRTNYYFFTQDEWQLLDNLALTIGLRFDDYDDVGSSTNPRAALVWNNTSSFTTKLMYGEAFRVPAFTELYVQSNPVALGNETLQPEKLRNSELAFVWHPNWDFSAELNFYYFHIDDYIDFVADVGFPTFTAQNIGRIDGQGVELEIRYRFTPALRLLANYSHQDTRDRVTDEQLGVAPNYKVYARLQWELGGWLLVPQVTHIGGRERQPIDPRGTLSGYTSFDLSMRHSWGNDWSMAVIVRNLTDEPIVEPSNGPARPGELPNVYHDLPQQGRSVSLELDATF